MGVLITQRIHLAVLILPIAWIFYEKEGWRFLKGLKFWTLIFFAGLISLSWFGYLYQVSRVNPDIVSSLFPQVEMYHEGSPIHLLATRDFYLRIAYYFFRYLLTPLGIVLFPFVLLVSRKEKGNALLWIWVLALAASVPLLPDRKSTRLNSSH